MSEQRFDWSRHCWLCGGTGSHLSWTSSEWTASDSSKFSVTHAVRVKCDDCGGGGVRRLSAGAAEIWGRES